MADSPPAARAPPPIFPSLPGPGGAVRPGCFTNLFTFDLLDNRIERDLDATGSSPANLVYTYAYDFNQNLITILSPLKKLTELDWDERDLNIAVRVGGPGGSTTIKAYDGNKNLTDVIGPAVRGTVDQTLTVIIADAFQSGESQTFSGDWLVHNTFDGFDRKISVRDAAGGEVLTTFDPGSRPIATQTLGSPGGPTPADVTGSGNVTLASDETRFDEAGRPYEVQQDVFLNTGLSGSTILHALPSGRAVTHTGGGLAANSTTNSNTATVTLTAGGISYVLTRNVFDPAAGRSRRPTTTARSRRSRWTARAGESTRPMPWATSCSYARPQRQRHALTTRVELCTIDGVTTTETFISGAAFDCMNRPVVTMQQGADGSFSDYWLVALDHPCAQDALHLHGLRQPE